MPVIQIISLLGAALILLAFALQQRGRWEATMPRYLWTNFAGASLLGVVAAVERQWGFLLLELVWAGVSLYGVCRQGSSAR